MAVARIVTRLPKDAELLAGKLRARGYTVEIVAPGAKPRGAAELEINLERCDGETALRRATELAHAGAADVFVAPGTFPRPEPAPREKARELPKAVVAAPEPQPIRTVWQAEPETERGSVVKDVATLARAGMARQVHRVRGLQLGKSAGATITSVLRRVADLAQAASASTREATRRAGVAIAAQRALRRQRGEQARQRRIRARAESRPAIAVDAPAALPRKAAPPARLPVIRRTRSRDYEWKTAGMFSVALAFAVMVGWLAANRRPSAPIPTSVVERSNSMKQQVPFGPVTLPPEANPRAHGAQAAKAVQPKPKPALRARSRQAADDEVVVRHFGPARTQPPAGGQVAVKRVVVSD